MIIFLNTKESESSQRILNNKGELITNSIDTTNSFNNLFCSVAPTIQSFYHYLTEPCEESILMRPCSQREILEIMSSLDNNKATGIKNIHIEILSLAKEQTAEHLQFIYNVSFTTACFEAV